MAVRLKIDDARADAARTLHPCHASSRYCKAILGVTTTHQAALPAGDDTAAPSLRRPRTACNLRVTKLPVSFCYEEAKEGVNVNALV
jgi:hypothetical protein